MEFLFPTEEGLDNKIITELNEHQVDAGDNSKTYSFEVHNDKVEDIRRLSEHLNYPMVEEYDFKNDSNVKNPNVTFGIKESTKIRSYQEKCLSKVFGNGRARSGIIVLPCGAVSFYNLSLKILKY